MAGGVHLAGDDFRRGLGALVAHAADPQDGVHAVFGVHGSVQLRDFHNHGGVDQHNDLFEVFLGHLDDSVLVVIQLQVMVVGVAVAFHVVGLGVHVFTAEAADHHERHVVIGREGAGDGLAVILHVRLQQLAGIVGVVLAALHGEDAFIQRPGLGVDMEAFALKALEPVHLVAGAAGRAGAAAGPDEVHRADAQEGDFAFVRLQGQGAVFVLEQHLALFHHLQVDAVARRQGFIQGAVVRVEMAPGVQRAGNRAGGFHIGGGQRFRQGGHAAEHHTKRQHQRQQFFHGLFSPS